MIVFHYTDAQGFLAVSRSKKLWASCIECLNDEREFHHGLDMAGDMATRLRWAEYPHLPNVEERVDTFVYALSRLWAMYIFSTSFSAKGDLLSQWRGYCGNGNGYNLGFDLEKMKTFCARNGYIFKPCVYETAEQEELLRPIIVKLFSAGFDDNSIFPLEERIKNASEMAADAVREHAPFMKDCAFREEEEWRLVVHVNSSADPRWLARPGRNSLVPYCEIDLSSNTDVFSQVTIGPGPFSREKLNFIARSHLRKVELGHINLVNSKVPFRYW